MIQTVCDRCGTTADRAPFSELNWSVALNARVCLNCYSRHTARPDPQLDLLEGGRR